ncbi:MerR family transcriptional regulator [Erythrobacter sp. YT30]|uniref:MerR family transcriptional regulator n=1 Tax=Erythrobacter sp. YT30 TaxID=1735012 RepID=UPI00076CF706|nr:MerR family transcriptional regulator [Erythrobacter sp. YT30]KWV93390.1 transcriptional regulator [Erythrobacter sp. YT30]
MADFDDGKDDGALRTIGEVSEALGIKTHVLRYWEQQFSLLKPLKRSGGRRYYRPSDVELVETINRLVNEEGYTLKGAESVLRSSGKSEFDRREDDRRASDRRSAVELRRASDDDGSKRSKAEMVAQLKGIRDRLDSALNS